MLQAGALGLAYGTAWLGAGTWWLYVSLHDYGGLPAWLAVLSVALLSTLLSLYLALAMVAFARWRSGRPGRDALLFAALWLLAELARGVIFTGFPCLATGYAQVDSPLGGYAPWLGVYGVGAVSAAAAALLGLVRWQRVRAALAVVASAAAVIGIGALAGAVDFSAPSTRLTVTLLQGNVP